MLSKPTCTRTVLASVLVCLMRATSIADVTPVTETNPNTTVSSDLNELSFGAQVSLPVGPFNDVAKPESALEHNSITESEAI